MKRSNLLFSALRWRPLAQLAVHAWAFSYRVSPRQPHWAFLDLKQRLGWRARRRVRLFNGLQMVVDPFERVGGDIARDGQFEPRTVDIISRLLKPGAVFFDCGSHVGQYSVIASSIVGPSGAVHAFEPDPGTRSYLEENARLAPHRNIRCNGVALSDAPGEATFFLGFAENVGANSLRSTQMHSGATIKVPLTTLDAYIDANGVTRLDLLKADVEGAELLMLRGGEKSLRRLRPALVLEFSTAQVPFGYTSIDLRNYLIELGYDLYRVDEDLIPYEPREREEAQFNILALPAGTPLPPA